MPDLSAILASKETQLMWDRRTKELERKLAAVLRAERLPLDSMTRTMLHDAALQAVGNMIERRLLAGVGLAVA